MLIVFHVLTSFLFNTTPSAKSKQRAENNRTTAVEANRRKRKEIEAQKAEEERERIWRAKQRAAKTEEHEIGIHAEVSHDLQEELEEDAVVRVEENPDEVYVDVSDDEEEDSTDEPPLQQEPLYLQDGTGRVPHYQNVAPCAEQRSLRSSGGNIQGNVQSSPFDGTTNTRNTLVFLPDIEDAIRHIGGPQVVKANIEQEQVDRRPEKQRLAGEPCADSAQTIVEIRTWLKQFFMESGKTYPVNLFEKNPLKDEKLTKITIPKHLCIPRSRGETNWTLHLQSLQKLWAQKRSVLVSEGVVVEEEIDLVLTNLRNAVNNTSLLRELRLDRRQAHRLLEKEGLLVQFRAKHPVAFVDKDTGALLCLLVPKLLTDEQLNYLNLFHFLAAR